MNRQNKIQLLDTVFNQKDLSSISKLSKGSFLIIILEKDKNGKREVYSKNGTLSSLFNHTEEESEIVKARLLKKYELVNFCKLSYPNE